MLNDLIMEHDLQMFTHLFYMIENPVQSNVCVLPLTYRYELSAIRSFVSLVKSVINDTWETCVAAHPA